MKAFLLPQTVLFVYFWYNLILKTVQFVFPIILGIRTGKSDSLHNNFKR